MNEIRLGSLFDGIGVFPLAAGKNPVCSFMRSVLSVK